MLIFLNHLSLVFISPLINFYKITLLPTQSVKAHIKYIGKVLKGGFILSNQFSFNGLSYSYQNEQSWRLGYLATVNNGTWALNQAELDAGVSTTAPREIAAGTTVGVRAVLPNNSYRFSHWNTNGAAVTFIPNENAANVLFVMPAGNVGLTAVFVPNISIGDRVKINTTALNLVTGEAIPPHLHGLEVTVSNVRNNGTELLLDSIGWVYANDVTRTAQAVPSTRTVTVENGSIRNSYNPGSFAPGSRVEIFASSTPSERFTNWTVVSGGVTLGDQNATTTSFVVGNEDIVVRANFEDIVVTTPPTNEPIRVNDIVRINSGVQTWATGERIAPWVHDRSYPVIEIRTRNGVTEILLGAGVNSWIRIGDVARVSGTTPPPPSGIFTIGEQVRVKNGITRWATGEAMPAWVHGRTYPIIEIRTRDGVTQLLLGSGINSWIRAADVDRINQGTTPPPPTPDEIQLNEQVRIRQGIRTWATGEAMPAWVHGRTYPVIEIRTRDGVRQLLLGAGINSWIRAEDVERINQGTTPPPPTPSEPIRINDRIRINQNVQNWATGEAMPAWVRERTYPVIEIRTVGEVTQLLLGDGINSWIRLSDVTRV